MKDAQLKDAGIKLLWAGILVAALALAWQVGRAITDDRSPVVAKVQPGELSVHMALTSTPRRPVAVRGYVFLRDRFPPELCTGMLPGKPPRCLGPSLTLFDLDVTRLEMKTGSDKGVRLRWTTRPVAIYGDLNTASLKVREILA